MFCVTISFDKTYPRIISDSNKVLSTIKMITGSDNIEFNNGVIKFRIGCSESNLINLIKLIKSALDKVLNKPIYNIIWEEVK